MSYFPQQFINQFKDLGYTENIHQNIPDISEKNTTEDSMRMVK